MSEWRGLTNEGLHDPNEATAGKTAWCQCCGAIDCRPAAPCWCCEVYRADVEVERLTAERDALRAGGAVAQAAAGKRIAELAAEVERLSERPSLKQHEHVVNMGRALQDEVERLTADLAERDRRIEAALALHWDRHDAFDDRYIDCGVCSRPAPCPTVQALRGESDE